MSEHAVPVVDGAPPSMVQRMVAEGLGTFVLVFFGVGASLMSGASYVATALAFGLAWLVMSASVGRISGGHFNPAVTLGAALAGRIAWRDTPEYFLAQLTGGLIAGVKLVVLMNGFSSFEYGDYLGHNSFGPNSPGEYAWWAALLLELLLTAVFVFVFLAATDARNSALAALAPVTVGLALTMVHLASLSATGTSVNPVRSIGVGLLAGTDAIAQLWLFVLAPMLGAVVAGVSYPLLFGQGADPVPGSGLRLGPRLTTH